MQGRDGHTGVGYAVAGITMTSGARRPSLMSYIVCGKVVVSAVAAILIVFVLVGVVLVRCTLAPLPLSLRP